MRTMNVLCPELNPLRTTSTMFSLGLAIWLIIPSFKSCLRIPRFPTMSPVCPTERLVAPRLDLPLCSATGPPKMIMPTRCVRTRPTSTSRKRKVVQLNPQLLRPRETLAFLLTPTILVHPREERRSKVLWRTLVPVSISTMVPLLCNAPYRIGSWLIREVRAVLAPMLPSTVFSLSPSLRRSTLSTVFMLPSMTTPRSWLLLDSCTQSPRFFALSPSRSSCVRRNS
mmetsp:Transcript_15158/g.25131  ORF Transcript_15158/g.25131 Transcript_15158/m.25131 type:complete len:226 (-) Transcript_15158:4853-5530(-)